MQKEAALIVCSILAVTPLMYIAPVRISAMPSPLLIAVAILGLVAVCGAVFSLLLRNRGKKKSS